MTFGLLLLLVSGVFTGLTGLAALDHDTLGALVCAGLAVGFGVAGVVTR